MVFTSVGFVFAFLPIVLLGYALARRTSLRNLWLLAVSLLFYAIGSGTIVLVLIATTLVDWVIGRAVGSAVERDLTQRRRALVALSVAVNLGTLGWFKYANFAVDSLAGPVWDALGGTAPTLTPIALPIGISFFTFQRLSYVLDVGRGEAQPLRRPHELLLYIALFPQLIAGPIVRFTDIRAQLHKREHGLARFTAGVIRFAHGFAKKVIIADTVAVVADAGFALTGDELNFLSAWVAALAYTVQIYFDFSGYSDMAIGLGLMFGFDFPENFARPYSAISVTDFWRRWHITLSSWFRDYLYLPLGGSRGSSAATLRNLAIVFLLTGLWHGAAWTFIAWGIWHGALLVLERQTGQRPTDPAGVSMVWLRRLGTFAVVVLGWVLFRATTFGQVVDLWTAMVNVRFDAIAPALADVLDRRALAVLLLGLATAFLPRTFVGGRALTSSLAVGASSVSEDGAAEVARTPWILQAWQAATVLLLFGYSLVLVVSGTFSPFLYFRF